MIPQHPSAGGIVAVVGISLILQEAFFCDDPSRRMTLLPIKSWHLLFLDSISLVLLQLWAEILVLPPPLLLEWEEDPFSLELFFGDGVTFWFRFLLLPPSQSNFLGAYLFFGMMPVLSVQLLRNRKAGRPMRHL